MSATSLPCGDLPDLAWSVALAALPDVGPARLAALLDLGEPVDTFVALAAGRLRPTRALASACGREPAALLVRWRAAAAELDVAGLWAQHVADGQVVLHPGSPEWPAAFDDDPDAPSLLFVRGRVDAVARPSVAIVGTRTCTHYGVETARMLGEGLARNGVTVVSGLAAGIDGAAHRGALDAAGAAPVGVVGTGLDVPYPRGHGQLWRQVAEAGALVSECPLGTRPARWRFPARNRIIAALADVVVVVESPERGGAMHTVDEALRRDRPVLAVPGPVLSPASAGTNRLLRDVAAPCCDLDDVLLTLGLDPAGPAAAADARPRPVGAAAELLGILGWVPATIDDLVARSGLDLGVAAIALAQLIDDGWVDTDGPWYLQRRAERRVRRR